MARNYPGPQVGIGGGQTLNVDAALYLFALARAVEDETGVRLAYTEGTRSWEQQNYFYQGYRQGRVDPNTGKRFNPAYNPDDPRAYHLAGSAVDFGSGVGYRGTVAQKAVHRLGPLYGFTFPIGNELWHGQWSRTSVKRPIDTATVVATPFLSEEDTSMDKLRFITDGKDGAPWFITNGFQKMYVTQPEAQQFVDIGLAVFEEKSGGVNIAPLLVARIPGQ